MFEFVFSYFGNYISIVLCIGISLAHMSTNSCTHFPTDGCIVIVVDITDAGLCICNHNSKLVAGVLTTVGQCGLNLLLCLLFGFFSSPVCLLFDHFVAYVSSRHLLLSFVSPDKTNFLL